jgi:hypothetical protein
MSKETIKNVSLIVVGVILTAVFTAYQPQFKSILGLDPKVFWQTNFLNLQDGDVKIAEIRMFNDSNVTGDLTITVPGDFDISDFEIDGLATKPIIDINKGSTYIKIDSFYSKEDVSISISGLYTYSSNLKLASKVFVLEEIHEFPFYQKYKDNSKIFLWGLIIISLCYFSFITGYYRDKI